MCEVCHKWQPELGIQENELCLFEAFAFKSCKVLSASWKVMLSLLSVSSQGSVQLAGFSLEKAYLLHGALWGMRGVGAHDMLPVLSCVSCVWCIVRQKSQVCLRSTGVTAVETESRGERQQCRQQGHSLTQHSRIVSLEAKRCLQFHEACIIFPASEVLFSVFLCPTSAGAHSVLRLKRLEVNVTTARRTRPPHWSLALKSICALVKMGCVLNYYMRLQVFCQSATIQSLELHIEIHLNICLPLCVAYHTHVHLLFLFHRQRLSNNDAPPLTTRPFWDKQLDETPGGSV